MTTKQGLPGSTRQIIASNGIDIHVVTMGNGPAILLPHGWPHTWEIWRTVMPLLAVNHTVIAPDLRGLGGTTRAAKGYDLHTLADDANGVLDSLGIEAATVVGTATAGQLRPICEDLQEIAITGCAHLVPLEQPFMLAAAIGAFVV